MTMETEQGKEEIHKCIDHVHQLKDTWAFAAEDRGDGSFRANTCEVDLSKLLDRLSFIYNNIM